MRWKERLRTRPRFEPPRMPALRNAKPQRDNAFKVELAKRCLIRALTTVTT